MINLYVLEIFFHSTLFFYIRYFYMSEPIYIALLFTKEVYESGINDVLVFFNSIKPNNKLIIEKYIVDNTEIKTFLALEDFIMKYPTGSRATISVNTPILLQITKFFETFCLNIPSFSLNASALSVKKLKNVLTYGPYEQYSIMSIIMIFVEYQMKQFKVLYDPASQIDIFIKEWIELIIFQCDLLKIPISIDTLEVNKNYNIKDDSCLILLAEKEPLENKYINNNFLNQVPANSYIVLSDATNNINDIFENVTAISCIPFPIDYTTTSKNVYQSIIDKKNIFFGVYSFFDILYSLDFISVNNLPVTISIYVNIDPFQTIPSAYGYSSFDLSINGFPYGSYDFIFTSNVILQGKELELFNKYNNGGISRLPQSQSVFKSSGIVPFFDSKIFYCNQDYIKIYNECGKFIVNRFDKNITIYKNNQIIVSENLPCQFIISYNKEGFFVYIQNIFNLGNQVEVNSTMSKKTLIKYIID